MKGLTLEHIAQAVCGVYHGPDSFKERLISSVTTDSRKVGKDALFVAIKGERADGHRFVGQTFKEGALCALVEELPPDADPSAHAYIKVKSSLRAVMDLAADYRKLLGIPVVGIAGSVGKTSTKEMIFSVLSRRFRTLKTEGNFNNSLGLPLTVFRLCEEDEIAVLEMGISDFGEMHELAAIARPDICVMTNIGWCHLDNLKTRDGILKAKSEMFDFLTPDGKIIVNGDDDKLQTIHDVRGIRPVHFGLNPDNDFYADEIRPDGMQGISCRIHMPDAEFPVRIPMPGEHMVYNALAAAAVGTVLGMKPEEIREGIEQYRSISGRFHVIRSEGRTIIDDCYNANPVSMKASLKVLKEAQGRKIAVLGDMGELGTEERELHREVGRFAGGCGLSALYTAGPLAKELAEGAKETAPELDVRSFEDTESLGSSLPELLKKGDIVLIKASHFMHFEKLVQIFDAEA